MISLIVCSRKQNISSQLQESVAQTIDCDYEWVVIDNSSHQYNIFQAYNEGVRRAKGDILCFMHDDICYHSQGWGPIVERSFAENPNTALLGIVGAHIVPNAPAPLWEFQHVSTARIWTREPLCETPFDQQGELPEGGFWSGNLAFADRCANVPVANVDGLWMCCRAECFGKLRFDEDTFDGFHCYDADLSMQVIANGWDIMVNTEILVEHFGESILTPDYFRAADLWYDKWQSVLPIVRGVSLSPKIVETMKYYALDARRYEETLIENRRIHSTYAFRLGKALLKPLTILRKGMNS